MRVTLTGGAGPRQIYELAAARGVQIRRLSAKRDSLEEIFLRAMENGG